MCYAMLYLALRSFHTLSSGCLSPLYRSYYWLTLHCSFLTVLWRFGARKRVFVQDSNALTQTAHNVDCLPGTGKEIFLSQLLLWKSQCMLCIWGKLIDHSGHKAHGHVSSCANSAIKKCYDSDMLLYWLCILGLKNPTQPSIRIEMILYLCQMNFVCRNGR